MVDEADKAKDEDEAFRKKVNAKNSLENYAFTLRNSVREEPLSSKIDAGDKQKIESAVDETVKWLDANPNAALTEYETKQKDLEAIANPIMTKLYQQGAGAGAGQPGAGFPGAGAGFPGAGAGFPGAGAGFPGTGQGPSGPTPGQGRSGPTVEEVD